jgi:hypothetical protein
MGLAGLKGGGIKGALGASLGGLAGLALTQKKDKSKQRYGGDNGDGTMSAAGNMASM